MKAWLEAMNDPSRDVYERRYRLLCVFSTGMLILWLIAVLLTTGEGFTFRVLFFGACAILLIPATIIAVRTGRIQLGARLSSILLVFLMVPMAFFLNGGIDAGAPNWCVFAMVYVTLTVQGRLRNILLVSDAVVIVICFVVAWFRPDLVLEHTPLSAYVDSLSSVIITVTLIATMFLFQLHIANQERQLLEQQQREIVELNRAQNRFFSSMSHEIRTPVNTIVGLNEMILREEVSREVAEDAGQVRAAGKLLLHLINNILDMSRLESGQMTLSLDSYDVGELLSEVVGMMWVHVREKGLAFHVDVDPRLPATLYGDDLRIRQILINVLNNAVKYTQKGSVTLSAQWKPGEGGRGAVVFQIADTGQGIKKENLPTLFTAFKRVENEENRHIEGTGLGLSIVKQLVDCMGGSIAVNSVYMKGSTFIIEIPQNETGAGPIGEMNLEARHSMNQRAGYTRRFEAPEARALVVDDEPANRMVVTKLLRETGMRIDTAAGGEEALEMTLKNAYHLIFMDHLMPDMDGITCLKRIRTQMGGLSKQAKVVALTANADAESRHLYAQSGFDGYLAKPCGGEALERECIRLLPRELVRLTHDGGEIIESSMQWMSESERREEIVITTDSIADLPDAVVQQYRIGVIPHCIQTAEGYFRDGLEIESHGLIAYLESGDTQAKTLPPEVSDYEAFFARQLSRANHVLHISISARLPGSGCANAREAARAFNNVTVVDSAHLSSGQGLMVIEACRMAQEGLHVSEIAKRLEASRDAFHTSFIVDSMDYLEKAELVNHRFAHLAGSLMIRPLLRLTEGQIRLGRIFMGSRERSWRRYIASELRNLSAIDHRILFVTYVGLSQNELRLVREEIEKRHAFETVYYQKASPAIAVNCGTGTFGLLYRDKA